MVSGPGPGPCLLLLVVLASTQASQSIHKQKRQIFREQVSPHTGGKIPEDAFRTDRLALNRLNKEGIAVPDGVLLEARHRESHHQSHRHDPAISASIVKLVQHPDGRYAPPEGHYPFHNLIESTYIIRPPWGQAHNLIVPPHKTQQVPLTLPHPHPPSLSDDDLLAFNQLDAFYPDLHGTRIWTGFAQLFHDSPARFLRETAGKPTSSPVRPQGADYPSLAAPPVTTFSCGTARGKMLPDLEANCQVFHLCHTSGQKETFLCPKGMRFEAASSQCTTWTKVPCGPQRQ